MAEIKAIRTNSSSTHTMKIRRSLSWEEVNERRLKGLCVFCAEPETPDHHLKHKNISGILMIDGDEEELSHDDNEIVKIEVPTSTNLLQSNESDSPPHVAIGCELEVGETHTSIENNQLIQEKVKNHSTDSIHGTSLLQQNDVFLKTQVSISPWEFSHRSPVEPLVVYEDLPTVRLHRSKSQFALECAASIACQVFATMPLTAKLFKNRRNTTFSKTWWFKFKEIDVMLEDVQNLLLECLPIMATKTRYSSQPKLMCDMREHDKMFTVAKAVSVSCFLGFMLGITERDTSHGQKSVYEQIILVIEQLLQTGLVSQQVKRNAKIKFSKRWWFKYKFMKKRCNHCKYVLKLVNARLPLRSKPALRKRRKKTFYKARRFKFKHTPRDLQSRFEVKMKQNLSSEYPCLFLTSKVAALVHILLGCGGVMLHLKKNMRFSLLQSFSELVLLAWVNLWFSKACELSGLMKDSSYDGVESFHILNLATKQPLLWLQNNSEEMHRVSEVKKKKKRIRCKTWMFKYKATIKRVSFLLSFDMEVLLERIWAVQRIGGKEALDVVISDANKPIEYRRDERRWLANIYDWCLLNQLWLDHQNQTCSALTEEASCSLQLSNGVSHDSFLQMS